MNEITTNEVLNVSRLLNNLSTIDINNCLQSRKLEIFNKRNEKLINMENHQFKGIIRNCNIFDSEYMNNTDFLNESCIVYNDVYKICFFTHKDCVVDIRKINEGFKLSRVDTIPDCLKDYQFIDHPKLYENE